MTQTVCIHWDRPVVVKGRLVFVAEVTTGAGTHSLYADPDALPDRWVNAAGTGPPDSVRAKILSPSRARREGLL
jgi:hypothetical protein